MRQFYHSRLLPLAGLSLLFGAIGAAIVIIALGKPDRARLTIVGTDTAQRVYGGVEQQSASFGSSAAPVTVSIYDDLQCASCAAWYLRTVPPLADSLVRTRRARLVYHHFAMGQREREVGFYAATAAGVQGHQWQYVQIFFMNQRVAQLRGVSEQFLTRVAEQVPQLDVKQWARDRKSPAVERTLAADSKLAIDERLPARPAVIVEGPRGRRKLLDSPTAAQIQAAVAAVR